MDLLCKSFHLFTLQIPMDLLAQEWLEDKTRSPENRMYLLENVLPTLVIALEKLLESTEAAEDHEINPVNWLAQWLLRLVSGQQWLLWLSWLW